MNPGLMNDVIRRNALASVGIEISMSELNEGLAFPGDTDR